jgi:hypothetical protein
VDAEGGKRVGEQLGGTRESALEQPHELVEPPRRVLVRERLDHERHPLLAVIELAEHRLVQGDPFPCLKLLLL